MVSTTSYPVVAALTIARRVLAHIGEDIITNDNDLAAPSHDQVLSVLATIERLVSRSVEALCDARDLAKQIKLDGWYAVHIEDHVSGLDVDVLPEVRAAIDVLEGEKKR